MIDKYSAYWNDPKYGFDSYLSNAGLSGYQLQDSNGTMQLFSPEGNRYGGSQELIGGYDPISRYSQDAWNSGTLAFTDGLSGWNDAAKNFGYSDPKSYVEGIQGAGTWGQDQFGNYTFRPSSGQLKNFPVYDPTTWKDDLMGILRVAGPFMPVFGQISGLTDLISNAISGGGGIYEGGMGEMLAGGGSALPDNYWNMLADAGGTVSDAGTAGGIGGGMDFLDLAKGGTEEVLQKIIGGSSAGLGAADLLGLMQMGQAAGLTGAALEEFVQSGGTMGSTAAGGGGVGLGVSGGNILELLKKLGLNAPGGGMLSNLLGLGSGLYGLSLSGDMRDLAERALSISDPFGGERAQYATRLRNLYADPSSISKTPGYEAGIDAVTRKMAQQGYLGSGNMMTALHRYGGDFFDKEVGRLAALAGAQFNPSGASALLNGNNAANNLASQALASLGYTTRNMGL